MSSFFRRGLARLVPTLPSVRELQEYTLLSNSDDEGDDSKSSFCVKQEVVDGMDVGMPYTSDDTLLSDDDGSPPLSSPSNSFFVSEIPSWTLGSDLVLVSNSPFLVTGSETPISCNLNSSSIHYDGTSITLGNVVEISICSIYDSIVVLGNQPKAKSGLKNTNRASFPHHKIKFLPWECNGNAIFELPPLNSPKEGASGILEGMDRRSDGHPRRRLKR